MFSGPLLGGVVRVLDGVWGGLIGEQAATGFLLVRRAHRKVGREDE